MTVFLRTLIVALLAFGFISAPQIYAQLPAAVAQIQDTPTLAPLLKRVTPSVVSIAVRRPMTDEEQELMDDPLFQGLVPPLPPGDRNIYAAGSGVIIDAEQGFIVTGAHVVEDADEIVVLLSDGRRLPATTVGSDTEMDIAVVKIRANGLTRINMADSDRVEVGDFVLAIGNPFSIGQTVTSGIVSALRRRSFGPQAFEDFIQTDAAINLGSSGGALINLKGELIGMNAAVLDMGDTGMGNVGIGFAIPANTVRSIAGQLTRYGSAAHGDLGVTVSPLSYGQVARFGASGVMITRIEPQSAAATAGLNLGDVVTAVNGAAVRDPADLYIKTAIVRAGEVAELAVLRNGKTMRVRATLGARSKSEDESRPESGTPPAELRGSAAPNR
jgi:serine protease Do/serine protease DegQ